MTSKQKRQEQRETADQIARHRSERADQELREEGLKKHLETQIKRERRELVVRQIRESFALKAKYSREIGAAGKALLEGAGNAHRR